MPAGASGFRIFVLIGMVAIGGNAVWSVSQRDERAAAAGVRPDQDPDTRTTPVPPTPGPDETTDLFSPSPPPSEEVPLFPIAASASASAPPVTGPGGETLSYGPELAIDGLNETAWCVEGDGAGHYLRVDLSAVFPITGVGIVPGYDKIDPTTGEDRFVENRKIAAATFSFAGGTPQAATFADPLREMKYTFFPMSIESSFVQIEPTLTFGSTQPNRNYTCISEVIVVGLV